MVENMHTPTPWMVVPNGGDDPDTRAKLIGVDDQYGEFTMIARTNDTFGDVDGDPEANAAFIVRAANSHDDLVAALRIARGFIFTQKELERQAWGNVLTPVVEGLKVVDAALERAGVQP